jgi:hypothetical protein
LNYGNVQDSPDGSFYTREINIPFLLTVVHALSFRNVDVLNSIQSRQDDVRSPIAVAERASSVEDIMLNPRFSSTKNSTESRENMFLLTFDIYNEWDEPFKVVFEIFNDEEDTSPTESSTTIIHAGVTKRIILPISKIQLTKEMIQKPIPTAPGKQFVVTRSSQLYPEGLARALFWHKEELVGGLDRRGRLVMRWSCTNHRCGILSFRSFPMTPSFFTVIKADPIRIRGKFMEDSGVEMVTSTRYRCKTNHLCLLEWQITNVSDVPTRLIFRVCPVEETSTGVTYHDSNQVVLIGSLSTLLPLLHGGETTKVSQQLFFSQPGNYNVMAHIETIYEPKEVAKKSKYEAPEIVLEEVEGIQWFQPGIRVSIVE